MNDIFLIKDRKGIFVFADSSNRTKVRTMRLNLMRFVFFIQSIFESILQEYFSSQQILQSNDVNEHTNCKRDQL